MAKKKHEVKPGPHVGGPSAADDDVPHIELERRLTIQHGERGRALSAQRERSSNPSGTRRRRRGSHPDHPARK